MNRIPFALLSLLLLFAGFAGGARAATRTWSGAVSSDWFDAGNWAESAVPVAGDDVTIGTGTALLTADTPELASLSLTGTLVFTNWNTTLSAANVVIASGGIMTCSGPFTDAQMSNNVVVVCSNLTVAAGGRVDVNGKGYAGGAAAQRGYGPGRGWGTSATGSGGGYGGFAREIDNAPGGAPYGDAAAPLAPGSGGGGGNRTAGAGGGAIRIEASGEVAVNGMISANGVAGVWESYGGAGGSGGGVFITCRTLSGAVGGVIAADGGDGWYSAYSTPGGGGRIAVAYDTEAQGARPPVRFQALPGKMGTVAKPTVMSEYRGEIGTLWFTDSRFLDAAPLTGFFGEWRAPGGDSWAPATLLFSNVWLRFPAEGFALEVAGDLNGVGPLARLEVGGGTLHTNMNPWRLASASAAPRVSAGGGITLAAGALLTLYSAPAAEPEPWGAFLRVTNALTLENGSALHLYSHPVAAGSPRVEADTVRVLAGAAIDASGKGYGGAPKVALANTGFGPGAGIGDSHSGMGGGHAGFGGSSYFTYAGGSTYGSAVAPVLAGSGSGRYGNMGGIPGGGCVRLAARRVLVNGTLTAQGGKGTGPGGAGGAVFITCGALSGTNGVIRVSGGDSAHTWSGGGGGGRIAVSVDPDAQAAAGVPSLVFDAAPGVSGVELKSTYPQRQADLGTLWFSDAPAFVRSPLTAAVTGQLCGPADWACDTLIVSNTWIRFAQEGGVARVTNDALVTGSAGRLDVGGSSAFGLNSLAIVNAEAPTTLRVGGGLVLRDGGALMVFSAPTNGSPESLGAVVAVGGTLRVASNSWIRPHAHPVNGGAPLFDVGHLLVEAGGGFNADGLGWSGSTNACVGGFGPGGGEGTGPGGSPTTGKGAAGGYGGRGGGSYYVTAGGLTYGCSNAPAEPGSGGVPYQSARGLSGGGLIRVEAAGKIILDGLLTANSASGAGPGSGGGISLRCRRFAGGGAARANGGGNNSTLAAGGGGGRIAVWRTHHEFNGSATADAGTGPTSGSGRSWDPGKPGTVVWGPIPATGTTLLLR